MVSEKLKRSLAGIARRVDALAEQMSDDAAPCVHPGCRLSHFLALHSLTQANAALALGVSRGTVNDIVCGRRGITADMALRLDRWTGIPAVDWLVAQNRYDVEQAKANVELMAQIERIQPMVTT